MPTLPAGSCDAAAASLSLSRAHLLHIAPRAAMRSSTPSPRAATHSPAPPAAPASIANSASANSRASSVAFTRASSCPSGAVGSPIGTGEKRSARLSRTACGAGATHRRSA